MNRKVAMAALASALVAGPAMADSIGEVSPYFEVCVPDGCVMTEQPATGERLFNIACGGSPLVAVRIGTSGGAPQAGRFITDIGSEKTFAWPLVAMDDTVAAIMDSFNDPRMEDREWDDECVG